ncbi:MAG: hypothetical protein ACYTEU_03060, partial [Planctomycetota bacterium]
MIQAAERSGIVDAKALNDFFVEHAEDARSVDQILLSAPNFTEDVVLRLFAEVLAVEFLEEINDKDVPEEFIEHVPAPYAQHHYVIGISTRAAITSAIDVAY